ncbi:MAG: hypothetical protein KatS3mg131_3606 [Candidatus Tectimicrobiota bacterium]|nr:MAG: hypothetical protein KatS3mg131_3606 [Candidatus Tectomicrobia bacterium]
MRLLYLLSVWLHLLAAAVWIGGMAFLTLVLVPIVRQPEHRAQAPLLMHRTGRRFRTVGWTCLLVLFFTGLVNLVYRGLFWAGERPSGAAARGLGTPAAAQAPAGAGDFCPQRLARLLARPAGPHGAGARQPRSGGCRTVAAPCFLAGALHPALAPWRWWR